MTVVCQYTLQQLTLTYNTFITTLATGQTKLPFFVFFINMAIVITNFSAIATFCVGVFPPTGRVI